jgi:leucyl aminopeptidase
MKHVLIHEKNGIPLHYISTNQYSLWLEKQTTATQNWLSQTQFSGNGLSIVPNKNGNIELVVFATENPADYFAAGDLVQQLPAQQYLLCTESEFNAAFAFAWTVGAYQFTAYKTATQPLATLAINDNNIVEQAIIQAQAVNLVRQLVTTPASDMMPEHLQQVMADLAVEFNASTRFIVGDDLLTENYPTIHTVGRASIHPPRLLDLTWGDETAPKITLVGKGVCFDSGGLDLKPASGMRLMKKDMGGSAHVLGLARLIMANNLPVRLRVLIPAVENAVSSNAMRPGDVITTRKGITVEVDNTDAEGRLVLCDALAEAENDNPELLIDFATLTGAMRIALGTELPGFFSTNNEIAQQITTKGLTVYDPVWQMPLYQPYRAFMQSEIADMTNCASVPQGGAITAALYLQSFVNPETDWLHFDVMAWNSRKQTGRPIGGEAFGIRAVYEYLADRYQQ